MKFLITISLIISIIFIILIAGCKVSEENKMLEGKNILIVISPGNFRDEELEIPKDRFLKERANVIVSSTKTGELTGMLGKKVWVHKTISETSSDEFDAIVFIGGSGVDEYKLYENGEILNLTKKFYEKNKVVAAICLAPKILANAGILKDKKATVFSGAVDYLKKHGAEVVNEHVVVSGKIITADGPHSADDFADKIVKKLG